MADESTEATWDRRLARDQKEYVGPGVIANKAGPRLVMICFTLLALAVVCFLGGSDLFQKRTDKLGTATLALAIALPLVLIAWRALKLGRITVTPRHLSYPKILGSRVIQWDDVERIEFGVLSGEWVALRRIQILTKDGKHRIPGGFTSGGDPDTLQQNLIDLQRALAAYSD